MLSNPVSILSGQQFSVVIHFSTPGYNYPIPVEEPVAGYSAGAVYHSGESFASKDGKTWTDISTVLSRRNACIKAYTAQSEEPVPVLTVSPDVQPVSADAGTTTFMVENNGNGQMNWTAGVTSGKSWLQIATGSSGTDTGTITCSFSLNPTTDIRTAVLQVTADGAEGSPVIVYVIQSGATFPVVGSEPGTVQVTLDVNQDVELVVNSTNTHSDTPVYEWLPYMFIYDGIQSPIYLMTDTGSVSLDDVMAELANYTFSFDSDGITYLGTLSMADFSLTSGDWYLYGYAYMNPSGTIIIDNTVTIGVQ